MLRFKFGNFLFNYNMFEHDLHFISKHFSSTTTFILKKDQFLATVKFV